MLLDFEKPIENLLDKLKELKTLYDTNKDQKILLRINDLSKKIDVLREETFKKLTNWQRVELARHEDRPYTLDYIYGLSEDFIELHGDRLYSDDPAIVGGIANLDGQTIMFLGHQKGRNIRERQKYNFAMAKPSGYRKALRLMHMAEHFGFPIVTFIDTPGADPGIEAEETGQGEAIAHNIQEMLTIQVPMISIIIGEGASGGALGIAMADKLFMLENSWFSVISPESCSSILYGNRDHKEEMATMLHLTSYDMLKLKIIDGIIKEPLGGAHKNHQEMINTVKEHIKNVLNVLKKDKKLVEHRIEKYNTITDMFYTL